MGLNEHMNALFDSLRQDQQKAYNFLWHLVAPNSVAPAFENLSNLEPTDSLTTLAWTIYSSSPQITISETGIELIRSSSPEEQVPPFVPSEELLFLDLNAAHELAVAFATQLSAQAKAMLENGNIMLDFWYIDTPMFAQLNNPTKLYTAWLINSITFTHPSIYTRPHHNKNNDRIGVGFAAHETYLQSPEPFIAFWQATLNTVLTELVASTRNQLH